VKDNHLTKLMNLPLLEELNLGSCPVGDRAIQHFANHNVAPNLTSLDLADSSVTDLGMGHIAQFTKLTRLSLFYCSISNGGLRHLAKLTELQELNLDSRDISDEGLRHLCNLKNLKSLDVFSGRVTDIGCGHISKIKSLESLELCGGGVADTGCQLLGTLENLTSLNLSQNERITNRGAAALAALLNLKALNLSHTRVNVAALRYFSNLRHLQSLALYGCRGVEDTYTLDQLHSGLPRLKCIRLNSTAVEDGMVIGNESDENENDYWAEDAVMDTGQAMDEVDTDDDFYSDHD
jgi:Leucine-rich repeat (LRR) protein